MIAEAVAAPAVNANEFEVNVAQLLGVEVAVSQKLRVKFPTVPVIARFVKEAVLPDALTVVVPERVPVPEAMVAVIQSLEVFVPTIG